MVRMLVRLAVFLVSSAIGLLVAWAVLRPDLQLRFGGFLVAVVVFTAAQGVLAPFIANMTRKHASAFLGGVGLLSTFVALLIATLVGDGLSIRGVTTWVLASLIVWLATAIATMLVPVLLVKRVVNERTDGGRSA